MSNHAIPLDHISQQDIVSFFNNLTFIRGRNYYNEGRVLTVEVSDDRFTASATVKGSGNQKYHLGLGLYQKGSQTVLFSECDCPVGKNCKHVVATLLHLIHHGIETVSPLQAWFEQLEEHETDNDSLNSENNNDQLLYILIPKNDEWHVEFRKGKTNKTGVYTKGRLQRINEPHYISSWEYSAEEIKLFHLLAHKNGRGYGNYQYKLKGKSGDFALQQMLATGRCFLEDNRTPLKMNRELKELEYQWVENKNNTQKLQLMIDGNVQWHVIPTQPIYYFDTQKLQLSKLSTPITAEKLNILKTAPAVADGEIKRFSHQFLKHFPAKILPKTLLLEFAEVDTPLQTKLTLTMIPSSESRELQPVVEAQFIYAEYHFPVDYEQKDFSIIKKKARTVKVNRNLDEEMDAIELLESLDLYCIVHGQTLYGGNAEYAEPSSSFWTIGEMPNAVTEWVGLINSGVAQCREAGMIVEIADDFDLNIVEPDLVIDVDDEEDSGWFSMSLTAEVNEQQVELLPLIAAWLSQNREPDDDDELLLPSPYGGFIKLKASAIRPIISLIEELFSEKDDSLKVPFNRAMLLNELSAHEISLINGQRVKALADKLANFQGIEAVSVPKSINATLREYQHEGLNWLCFLKEYGFGGILADDMGLGKTLQTLTFIAKQQEDGKNQKGSLIICPTSLVGNWQKEAQKFAPSLNVAVCHGTGRRKLFKQLDEFDVVITTYPLITRDSEHYLDKAFDHIILDEAQLIKNAKAKSTQQINDLKAGFKLCLSGTPLENHLGELKSLMDFSLLGLLGNHQHFKKYFRQPIEKEGNSVRADELTRRISPFLLRRTKGQVMAELPEKMVIEQDIILEKDQRNLYESIRVAMEQRIRELFAQKGVAKSHIEFLDALLKLRQACCDARLVKLEQAQKVRSNAKLDWLTKHIPEMIAEGRKILIFSQFTTMLGFIEDELKQLNIPYSKLTGQTRKRQIQIDNFQEGDNPVFLISLKAGGTGLNLTAADTVIHYDPWWNPAVEKQATDRTHRIGQDKAVFVYKLIAEGTIEEKIKELQKHKQDIADSVLSGKKQSSWSGNADELLSLFKSE